MNAYQLSRRVFCSRPSQAANSPMYRIGFDASKKAHEPTTQSQPPLFRRTCPATNSLALCHDESLVCYANISMRQLFDTCTIKVIQFLIEAFKHNESLENKIIIYYSGSSSLIKTASFLEFFIQFAL